MFVPPRIPDHPFTRPQADALGITRPVLDRWLGERRVRRVLHGVYQRADLPDTIENRARAAALVTTRFVVLCDRTAAWLLGVDVLGLAEHEILPPLETYALQGHSRTVRSGCNPGERDLAADDICSVEGVAITKPLRTALDLGCKLPRRMALAALDSFMREFGITREDLEEQLPRYRRRRGVVQLRDLVALADPRSESPRESWTRLEIHDAGLPKPEPQYWVYEDGRPIYRLDLAYPFARVVVEYDGQEFHLGKQRVDADRKRRKWLEDRGWKVIVVRRGDFHGPARDAWLAELRVALRLAA